MFAVDALLETNRQGKILEETQAAIVQYQYRYNSDGAKFLVGVAGSALGLLTGKDGWNFFTSSATTSGLKVGIGIDKIMEAMDDFVPTMSNSLSSINNNLPNDIALLSEMFENSWNEEESDMMIKELQGKGDFDSHLSYHLCGTIAGLLLDKFNERKPAMKEACDKVVRITTEEDLHEAKLADLHRSMSSTFNHGVGGIFRNDIINPVSGLISSKITQKIQDKINEDKKLQQQLEENQKIKKLQESVKKYNKRANQESAQTTTSGSEPANDNNPCTSGKGVCVGEVYGPNNNYNVEHREKEETSLPHKQLQIAKDQLDIQRSKIEILADQGKLDSIAAGEAKQILDLGAKSLDYVSDKVTNTEKTLKYTAAEIKNFVEKYNDFAKKHPIIAEHGLSAASVTINTLVGFIGGPAGALAGFVKGVSGEIGGEVINQLAGEQISEQLNKGIEKGATLLIKKYPGLTLDEAKLLAAGSIIGGMTVGSGASGIKATFKEIQHIKIPKSSVTLNKLDVDGGAGIKKRLI